jgi:tetratricopeptide (TPR) repeat protein
LFNLLLVKKTNREFKMMIKVITLSAVFLLTPFAFADAKKPAEIDMTAANKAHASIKTEDKKKQPFWSDEQSKQAGLEQKYKKAIAENPDDKKPYAYLAGLYLTNNKTSKAITAYQEAITQDAENPKLFAALSIAYLHHAKYDMASAMATEALRLDPKLSGVKKINDYVVAKKEAIDAATKVPAGGSKYNTSGKAPHGGVMPAAVSTMPSDKLHKPN